MALKPTIFKFTISLSNLDSHCYDEINLTVAQHPSETTERMMARVLAFGLNASENLAFAAGLSTPNEPDIWNRGLDNQLLLWVDVGEPGFERIKKATRFASIVKVYSFNSKSDVWWQQEQKKFKSLTASFFQFPWQRVQLLASYAQRSMSFSMTISDKTIYLATESGEVDIPCVALQGD